MTISRVNAATWGVGDKLTSAQANGLDLNTTYALDKRSGQTDTLSSIVSCSGAGRIIPTYLAGTDADTTYTLSTGISVLNATSGLTANRIYTLSTTGAVAGDTVIVLGHATYDVTVKVSSTTLLVVGAGNTGTNQSRWGEFLYTGSTWILMRSSYGAQQQRQVFTANGTYTVPADCWKLLVVGCGSGGGGGGGAAGGNNGATDRGGGGGGGGAAEVGFAILDVTPGAAYAVTIASASSGGTGGVYSGAGASNGNDGSSTTFGSAISFRGGQGGVGNGTASGTTRFAPGGGPVQGGVKATIGTSSTYTPGVRIPGEGGYGSTSILAAAAGSYSVSAWTTGGSGTTSGGAAGATGADGGGGFTGGGGGGGGGASAFGDGGAGGAGGAGAPNPANAASNGVAGSAGTAGSGGGGGGAGGNASGGSPGNGNNGGAGGAGILIAIPIR